MHGCQLRRRQGCQLRSCRLRRSQGLERPKSPMQPNCCTAEPQMLRSVQGAERVRVTSQDQFRALWRRRRLRIQSPLCCLDPVDSSSSSSRGFQRAARSCVTVVRRGVRLCVASSWRRVAGIIHQRRAAKRRHTGNCPLGTPKRRFRVPEVLGSSTLPASHANIKLQALPNASARGPSRVALAKPAPRGDAERCHGGSALLGTVDLHPAAGQWPRRTSGPLSP